MIESTDFFRDLSVDDISPQQSSRWPKLLLRSCLLLEQQIATGWQRLLAQD
jgi:hypothetical protein